MFWRGKPLPGTAPAARHVVAGFGARSNGGRNTFPLDATNNFDVALTFDIGAQAFNLFNHAQFVGGDLNDVTRSARPRSAATSWL